MKSRITPLALLGMSLGWTVLAQGQSPMREGNWEVSVKMNMGGMDVPPIKQTQCVTSAMLKDPQSSVPSGPGGGDCKVTDYKLTCTQPAPMSATGEIKYAGPDAYTGTLVMDAGGMSMALTYDAKRIGDCPK